MKELFGSILGEQLSSVEFVQDYLQLHFDGSTLTCYSWPKILVDFNSYEIFDNGYRDAICKIIGCKIDKIYLNEKKSLSILFDKEYQIILNLFRDESNQDLPEFAYFTDTENNWFVLD